jgi:acyl-CoA thioesterase YciA
MTNPLASSDQTPGGELVIRTIAMPADTNANGDIFGGWLMAQMDLGGAVLAKMIAQCRVVTIAADGMSFLSPVAVGDMVSCYARVARIGRTSIRIDVEVWVHRGTDQSRVRVTEGAFTYVAIDAAGKPQPVQRGSMNNLPM